MMIERVTGIPPIVALVPLLYPPTPPPPFFNIKGIYRTYSLVLHHYWLHCGRELRPGAKLGTEAVEDDRDRHQHECDAAEERAGVVDLEGVEHVDGEEGEDGTGEGAKEGVGCDGGGGAVGGREVRCGVLSKGRERRRDRGKREGITEDARIRTT